ncbi:MAG TPA: hypothetical protein VJR89_28385, partial [Polyangiales bacterium]|nr:hypothetical protein [Polyangiales bacterium]
ASGRFELGEALDFETLAAASRADSQALALARARLLPLPAALRGCPRVTPTPEGVQDVRHGRALVAERIAAGELPAEGSEPVAVLDAAGELLALAQVREGKLYVTRGFSPS